MLHTMSKAFTKETDHDDEDDAQDATPALPSGGKNYITPQGYARLREKGARRVGLHTMVASNELSGDYHVETARILFELAVDLKRKIGIRLEFVNAGGGAGIPYRPEEQELDIEYVARGMRRAYDEIVVPAGLDPLGLRLEWGRIVTGPYGWLVTTAIHEKAIA